MTWIKLKRACTAWVVSINLNRRRQQPFYGALDHTNTFPSLRILKTNFLNPQRRIPSIAFPFVSKQGCRLGPDRCPHRGCAETKRVLLHVKTCAAGLNVCCPENYRGCEQAKKLLAHYRRCKDLRARSRNLKQQPYVCLVCSLMARHARSLLEGNLQKSSMSKTERWRARIIDAKQPSEHRDQLGIKIKTAKKVDGENSLMPPPPPRLPREQPKIGKGSCTISSLMNQLSTSASFESHFIASTSSNQNSSSSRGANDDDDPFLGTPPRHRILMQRRIESVAAVAAPRFLAKTAPTDPSVLGKSYDSSRKSYFPDELSRSHHVAKKRSMSIQEYKVSEPNSTTPSIHLESRRSSSCGSLSRLFEAGDCGTIEEEDSVHGEHIDSKESSSAIFQLTEEMET